ncbi:hypothetical protein JCM10207_001033 [Rhodosporidiobolus poonsookiae]
MPSILDLSTLRTLLEAALPSGPSSAFCPLHVPDALGLPLTPVDSPPSSPHLGNGKKGAFHPSLRSPPMSPVLKSYGCRVADVPSTAILLNPSRSASSTADEERRAAPSTSPAQRHYASRFKA